MPTCLHFNLHTWKGFAPQACLWVSCSGVQPQEDAVIKRQRAAVPPQGSASSLGEVIAKTLALLEERGGINAFINIKYMCPAYESVRGR